MVKDVTAEDVEKWLIENSEANTRNRERANAILGRRELLRAVACARIDAAWSARCAVEEGKVE